MRDRAENEATRSTNYRAGEYRAMVAALNGMPKRRLNKSENPDYILGYNENYKVFVKKLGFSQEEIDYRHGLRTGEIKRKQKSSSSKKELKATSRFYQNKSEAFKRGFEEGIGRTSKKGSYEEMLRTSGEVPQSERESTRRNYEEYVLGWKNGATAYKSDAPFREFDKNEPEQYQLGWEYGYEYAASQQSRSEDQQAKKHKVDSGSSESKQVEKRTEQNTIQDKQNRVMPLTSDHVGFFKPPATKKRAGEELLSQKKKRRKSDHSAEFRRGYKNGWRAYGNGHKTNRFNQGQSEDYKDGWIKGYEEAKKDHPLGKDERDRKGGKTAARLAYRKAGASKDGLERYESNFQAGLYPMNYQDRSPAYVNAYREQVKELIELRKAEDKEQNVPKAGQTKEIKAKSATLKRGYPGIFNTSETNTSSETSAASEIDTAAATLMGGSKYNQVEKKTTQSMEESTERPSARGSLMLFDPRTPSMANNAKHSAEADVDEDAVSILLALKHELKKPR